MRLYNFQKKGVKILLSNNENYLLADEQGLGKSVQAAAYLKLRNDSLPAIIVCPASLKVNWSREIEKWTGVKTFILEGKTPGNYTDEFIRQYPVWIVNYDILGYEDKQDRAAEKARKEYCKKNNYQYRPRPLPLYGWCDEIVRHNFSTIICDEVQYISDPHTLRSRAVQKICKNNARKIFLSGTPYETKTSQFYTVLNILNKKMFPSRWQYLMRYCGAKKTFFGWQFNGLSNGEELHNKISRFMIRRLKKDVLQELPPKQRIVVPIRVSDSERQMYENAEMELREAIASKEINALTKLSALKQISAETKLNAAINWANDYLDSGNKLVIFTYHTKMYNAIMERFKKIAVGIDGSVAPAARQTEVDKFQNDKTIKLFVGQISACCTGLTLTSANAVAFLEFGRSYPQMVQAEDRIHRISQAADSVFAYYLVLENSIDEIIMDTINSRSVAINKVMDNDNSSMFSGIDLNDVVIQKLKSEAIR